MNPSPEQILNLLGIDHQHKSGRLSFHCPLHDDRNPSAAFYLDTNLGHCFSCAYTVDPIQFYAKVTNKNRAQAIRDLERTLGQTIDTPTRTVNPLALDQARRRGERHLATLRHLPRREHARRGETLDRILLAHERGQIDNKKLDKLLKIWYNNLYERTDTIHPDGAPEARPPHRIQEGPGHLPGLGHPAAGDELDDERPEDAPDLA